MGALSIPPRFKVRRNSVEKSQHPLRNPNQTKYHLGGHLRFFSGESIPCSQINRSADVPGYQPQHPFSGSNQLVGRRSRYKFRDFVDWENVVRAEYARGFRRQPDQCRLRFRVEGPLRERHSGAASRCPPCEANVIRLTAGQLDLVVPAL